MSDYPDFSWVEGSLHRYRIRAHLAGKCEQSAAWRKLKHTPEYPDDHRKCDVPGRTRGAGKADRRTLRR